MFMASCLDLLNPLSSHGHEAISVDDALWFWLQAGCVLVSFAVAFVAI